MSFVSVEAKSVAKLFGVIPVKIHPPVVPLSLPAEPVCRQTSADEENKSFKKYSISFNFEKGVPSSRMRLVEKLGEGRVFSITLALLIGNQCFHSAP